MKSQKVIVASISECKNGNADLMRVEFRTEAEKAASANKVGFLCKGAAGITPSIEKRVAWENVSKANIAAWGLKEGDDFSAKVGVPCQLVIKETATPQYEGHKAKVNPSTGEILKKDGMPIYRSTTLSFDMTEEDILIAHDKAPVAAASEEVKKEEFETSENA